ncbi:MAG TPA: CHAT domain-containing tetratricopeptide repeat protein [Bryobacteraceae bacterium]|nr:CHAT domain-containing tetratricopeptide repeat protein [Bryobacteraceae bacterium]
MLCATRLGWMAWTAVALCWSPCRAADVEPTAADREFAAALAALPEDQARATLAAADRSRITEGLCRALYQTVKPSADRHHDLNRSLAVDRLGIECSRMGGFLIREGAGLYNASTILNNLGRYFEASDSFARALEVYQRAGAEPARIAAVYTNWGVCLQRLGNSSAAFEKFRISGDLHRKLGDEVSVARVLNNLGRIYTDSGDYRRAMQSFEQSLEIAVRRKETVGQGYVLNNMAAVAELQEDYDLAASYVLQSVKLKEAAASKEDLATSLVNLASVYHHGGKDRDAEEVLRRAIGILAEAGIKPQEANAWAVMGRLDFDLRRYAAAFEDLKKSAQLYHETGEPSGEAGALGDTARCLLERGDTAAALEMANRARDLARGMGATPQLRAPGFVAGRIYRMAKRDTEARAALGEAIEATEQMRENVAGGEAEREAFLAGNAAPYLEMTALEAAEGHWAAALTMAERSKGRVLLDLLGGRERRAPMTSVPDARETQLRGELATLGAQFRLASAETAPDAAKLRALRAQMDGIYAKLADFRLAFDLAHPELSVRRGDVQPVGWPGAAQLAGDAKTAILDYAVTPGGIYVFAITRGHPLVARRLRAGDLKNDIRTFREKLATRDPEFPDAARRLYQILVAPVRGELAAKTNLIVAPDGDLWQVPFQVLRTPEGRYLIEDLAVSYAPSLSVLAALRRAAHPVESGNLKLAVFGNPTGDWPEAENEARRLVALYGAGSRMWLGAEAGEEEFRQHAGSYDVIQVAAHGVFDPAHPQRSHIVFHPPQAKGAEDGWLEAAEIRELDLPAALVVLSGCETGRGHFEEGEGAVGLAWAFEAAGSRAVLASQWRVESASTTELMARFHSAWRNGSNKARALREAVLEVARQERLRHPFYWAGFQLFGDGY